MDEVAEKVAPVPVARKVGAVLVVGGGIGGVQAALDLADSGYRVFLAERSSAIGGMMAMLDKTFPTNDCSMCILSPKLVAAGRHKDIELMTLTEVLGVEGEPGAFKVRLKHHARSVDLSKCTGCGDCMTKCPVKDLPNEFEGGLSNRRAIYRLYAQAVPNAPMIDREHCLKFTKDKCGACQKTCKAGAIDYAQQDEEFTVEVGSVVVAAGSKVAPTALRPEYGHGRYPNVVTSLEFERILSASGSYGGHVKRPSDGKAPKRIAWLQCVGSRDDSVERGYCSAMCCMYAVKEAVIAREHAKDVEPTIFYMDMRSYGKDFDKYVDRAEQQYGVRLVRARVPEIREDPQTRNLTLRYTADTGRKSEEFDMVVLSCGFVPPAELVELSKRLDFDLDRFGFVLTDAWDPTATSHAGMGVAGSFAQPMAIPETVTGASSAAAAAEEILAGERGTLVRVVEPPAELDVRGDAPRIGVFVCHCGINIGGVVDVPGVVEYAKTLPNVVFATDNLFTCSQDTAVKMGEVIREHKLSRVVVASCSPRTHEGLFQENCEKAGLNRYLFEMANIRDQDSWVHMHEPEAATEKAKDLVRMAIAKAEFLKPLKPGQLGVNHAVLIIGGGLAGITAALSLADQGFASFIVEKEAELGGNYRKLHYTLEGVDTRSHLSGLLDRVGKSPLIRVFTGVEIRKLEGFIGNYKTTVGTKAGEELVEHGVVIVATGAYELETDEYLCGASEKVVTQRELETLIAGKDAKALGAQSVVMIQCVGSRIPERPYCSRYCCSEAVKNALKLKEADPNREVTVLYRDIRTFGFKEDYYKRAREADVRFVRYDEDRKPEVREEDGGLAVSVFDPVLNETIELRADLLALSVGTVPNPGNAEIGKMLKVPTNQDGFFLEAHVKLRPVDFATDGVFMCGMAHAPKFSDESITQANAAVSRACTILTKDFIEAEGKTAYVNKERCMACGLCEVNCPFSAIEVDEKEGAAVVNTVLCKGCGVCTASCRMNAADLNGFNNEEVLAQIGSLF